jgi:hypothetical protein
MKELNDDDFDKVFRTRITDAIPEFDNESWLKMEKKLRKRDRGAFYLNASILLLLLSFGFGFYFLNRTITIKGDTIAGKKTERKKDVIVVQPDPTFSSKSTATAETIIIPTPLITVNKFTIENKSKAAKGALPILNGIVKNTASNDVSSPLSTQQTVKNDVNLQIANKEQTTNAPVNTTAPIETTIQPTQPFIAKVDPIQVEENEVKEKKPKIKRKIPIILAINVGPDFNSTTTQIGGKAKLAFGVGLEVGVTKKVSLQTGLNYGRKDYSATTTDNLYYGSY